MIDIVSKNKCTGCGSCVAACPKQCIELRPDEEGFLYPIINYSECIKCNICEKQCHALEVHVDNFMKPVAYAAYNKDSEIREKSSSGGIFYPLAQNIIAKGGAVYGAIISENMEVIHSRATSIEEVHSMLGSKYVQSRIAKEIYKQIKDDLKNGQEVLFTGTPCQCGALKHHIEDVDTSKLFVMSFICHGVPSPKVWEKYVSWQNEKNVSKATTASFRDKSYGWVRFSMAMSFANGKSYTKTLDKDYYLQAFLKNNCLRTSCYECQYKGTEHFSDIDIHVADWWGADDVQIFRDSADRGISMVFVNNSKGRMLWNEVAPDMNTLDIDFERAYKSNEAYSSSAKMGRNRDAFMSNVDSIPFDKLAKKYCKTPFSVTAKRNVIRVTYFIAKKTGLLKIYKRLR